jgi:hypothetical protein
MPTPVDLVTDLPADFEVFGQAVDSSLADLKGGTSGQVLSKNSNTDMDFVWVTSDDANAIQNTIVDAKGDLIGATAADTPARLAVGSNGLSLVADSAESTGLKWGTPVSKGCGIYNTGSQSVNNTTDTTLSWNAQLWDTDNYHSTSTNPSRMTIPAGLGGKYLLTGTLAYGGSAVGARFVSIRVNGASSFYISSSTNLGAVFNVSIPYAMTLALNAGDYLEISTYHDAGAALNVTAVSRVYLQYLGA